MRLLLRSPWVFATSFAALALAHASAVRAQPGPGSADAPAAKPPNPAEAGKTAAEAGRPGAPLPTMRARVVVLPVVLGNGPDPDPLLVTALVRGLGENPNWDIVSPASGDALEPLGAPSLPQALIAEVDAALQSSAAARSANDHAAVVATLEPVMQKLLAGLAEAPAGAAGATAAQKLGAALLTAQIGAGSEESAAATAANLKLLLPGRTLGQAEGFSLVSSALMQSVPAKGVALELASNPKGCRIVIDGQDVGAAPVTLQVRPQTKYAAHARCDGKTELQSFPRVVTVADAAPGEGEAAARGPAKFLLDAILPTVFERNDRGARLRFADAEHRRSHEEAYVPRLAERFGANNVVLVSVGEFQGNAWLNARLYLSSGYKNRHGLARMESARAAALGRYLSTGRESPGVLNAEEAGNMVAASQTLKPLGPTKVERSAWYEDAAGWSLLGAGAISLSLGLWSNDKGDDKRTEAAMRTRNDPIRRDRLQSEASSLKFWGSVGMYTGAVLIGTGVFLLALPEYQETRSSIYGIAPLPGGGGAVTYAGRF